jgi:hypothetical protein
VSAILSVAAETVGVCRANGLITVQLAPDRVLAALSLEFADDLRAREIEQAVAAVEASVRTSHPKILASSSNRKARHYTVNSYAVGSGGRRTFEARAGPFRALQTACFFTQATY